MPDVKYCPSCGKNKPVTEFYFSKDQRGSLLNRRSHTSRCKECLKRERKERYANFTSEEREKYLQQIKDNRKKGTTAQRVHKQCELWRDWLIKEEEPTSSLLWKGVMNLMFFTRDHSNAVVKMKDWYARIEKAMNERGYTAEKLSAS